ncbi:MAG: hypothetical protein ACE5RO_05885 [Candidatus Nitrosomaritimum yanchengensis]
MDRIKRLSYEVLNKHQSKFGEDFAGNKKILDQISIIRSKGLKNEVAGYITKYIKKQIREEKAKQTLKENIQSEDTSESEFVQDSDTSVDTHEIIVESSETISESEPIEKSTE